MAKRRQQWKQVERIQAPKVRRRLQISLGLTPSEANKRIEALSKFLFLASANRRPLSPSRTIDETWHVLLADNCGYEEFCLSRFDAVLAHEAASDRTVTKSAFQRTASEWRRLFGNADWRQASQGGGARCVNCAVGPKG